MFGSLVTRGGPSSAKSAVTTRATDSFPRTVWSPSLRLWIFAGTGSAFSSALHPCCSLQPNKYLMHDHSLVTATSFPEEEWMCVARVCVLSSTSVNRRIRTHPCFIYAYSDAMPCSDSVQVEKNTLLGGNIPKIHKRAIFCRWRRDGCSGGAHFSLFRAGYLEYFPVEKWGDWSLSKVWLYSSLWNGREDLGCSFTCRL